MEIGLYKKKEKDIAWYNDNKVQKIEFLAKIIKVVSIQLNVLIDARPKHILACQHIEVIDANLF